jgi:hypothetical protein
MIGGEAAEWAALERRPLAEDGAADDRDPCGLGWVADWLYGDAVLPPMPLPPEPEPALPWRRQSTRAEAQVPRQPRRDRRRDRRRAPQLTLL